MNDQHPVRLDPDLLRPSLGEADRADGFDRPFDPGGLVFVGFFGGFLAGGLAAWLNDRRLGLHARARRTLRLTILLSGLAYAAGVVMLLQMTPEALAGIRTPMRVVNRILPALFAGWLARGQQARFEIFEASDGQARSIWRPAIGMILLSLVLSAPLMLMTLGRVVEEGP